MMNVSVIVPIFNASHRIESVLELVLAQTYQAFEIILINDSSTDNTIEILDDFINRNRDSNILLINLQENKGVSYCRNRGWNLAIGDYVAFLDSDDFWHKDKLKIMIDSIEYTKADFVGHKYTEATLFFENNFVFEKSRVSQVSLWKLLLRNRFQTSCVLIRKEIRERFDESISHSEDYELFLRLCALRYKIYHYDDILTLLGRPQLSKGGLSEKKWRMRMGEIKAYRSALTIRNVKFVMPAMYLYSMLKFILKLGK